MQTHCNINYTFLEANEPRDEKKDFYLCKNKDADQLCSNCTDDSAFVFATQIVQSLLLNPKFQASSLLL